MPRLSDQEIGDQLMKLAGWGRVELKGAAGIQKAFKTGNFLNGLGFVTRVAVLAEKANHHPDVTLTYPRVVLQLTTHDAGGLTEEDFELAERIEQMQV